MNIPLKEFLEALTYDNLFDRVTLPCRFAEYIHSELDWDKICYVDNINPLFIEVYYPLQSWVQECKRIQDIDNTLAANQLEQLARRQVQQKADRLNVEVMRLKGLMIKAAMNGDTNLCEQIGKQIKEMTT